MKKSKLACVFIFGILAGQYLAVIFSFDLWPLSSYPMFAELQTLEKLRAFRVEAVVKDGKFVRLPYSNWPGWWNYIEFYLTDKKQLVRLKEQMIFDLNQAALSRPDLKLEEASELHLVESYASGESVDRPLFKKRTVAIVNVFSGEIQIVNEE